MKSKKLLVLAPLAAALGLGMAGNAQAEAYAYSFNDIFNLTTVFDCSNAGVGCSGTFDFTSYQSSSGSDANVDPNNTSGTQNAQVTSATIVNGQITGFSPQVNPDAPVSYQEIGGPLTPAPTNNDFSQIGRNPGDGVTDYAEGDAQIVSQQVDPNASTTRAINEAEGWITTVDGATANGQNGSTTGFEIGFTISDTFTVAFDFDAAPFMEAFIGTGGTATADLDVSFTIRDLNDTIVFNWQPNGQIDSIGGTVGGTETSDDASLNLELADTTDDGTSEFYNPTCNLTTCDYTAISGLLAAGSYTLILTMHEGIVLGQTAAVPEPATLALMGLGLLGVGGFTRKKLRKV